MAFDPDKYLSSKKNKATIAFDPDAYLSSQDQGDWESSYGSASQREAKKRLQERGAENSPSGMSELKKFTSLGQKEANDGGDALYAAANFGGLLPKGVALGETITGTKPLPEGGFLDNLKANLAIEKEVAKQRKERSPVASTVGEIGGDIAAYTTGTKLLKAAPVIGEVAGGNKIKELIKLLTRGGATNATISQLRGKDISKAPLDFVFGALAEGQNPLLGWAAPMLRNTGSRVMNTVIGAPKKALEGEANLGRELLDRGVRGSAKKMLSQAEKGIEENLNPLDEILTKYSSKNIDKSTVVQPLEKLKSDYVLAGNKKREIAQIQRAIDEIKARPEMTPKTANEVKQAIYKTNKGVYDKDTTAVGKNIEKLRAGGYRKAIEDIAPEVIPVNKNLGTYYELQDLMQEALNKGKKIELPNPWNKSDVTSTLLGGKRFGTNLATLLDKAGKNLSEETKIGKLLRALKNINAPALSSTLNE